jgi:hypothetical protein
MRSGLWKDFKKQNGWNLSFLAETI